MNADVVGYSRLMATDELGTFNLWLSTLERIQSLVSAFGGRLVDAPGDNVLAEFERESDAVWCAIRIQRGLAQRDHQLECQQLRLRIGVHTGELLSVHGRLYGSTVNIAARLQQAADPSTVLLSERVAERVDPSLQRRLCTLGRLSFRNIPYPVATLQACVGE